MKVRTLVAVAAILIVAASTAACLPGGGAASASQPAGFFLGVWHGWLAPLSLILGLFEPGGGIYEVHNTGLGYDFGFYISVIGGFGSFSFFRRKGKKD